MHAAWHALTLEGVLGALRSGLSGLSSEEARKRLLTYGRNTIADTHHYSTLLLLFGQFRSPLVAILLVASGISVYLGHYSDAVFILVVLLINTGFGFYQEYKADASLESLKKLVKVSARLLRDGQLHLIDSSLVVPGDILVLKAGDKVPADARLVESKGLSANEASLTGEWVAVAKTAGDVPEGAVLAERTNMLYMGTVVESGSARAVVIETGSDTEIGQITSLVEGTQERATPLQRKMAVLARKAGLFILIFITIVAYVGYLRENTFGDILVSSLALAVSAIPAGLLPAITIALAIGTRRILRERGLVRRLAANETLGSVTVICTDKTGTLTEGTMEVSRVLTGTRELLKDDGALKKLPRGNGLESHVRALESAVLANEAFIENPADEIHKFIVRGSATERALLLAGMQAGIDKRTLDEAYPLVERISFDSEKKFAASKHKTRGGHGVLYVIGAPEVIEQHAEHIDIDGKRESLGSAAHKHLADKLDTLTAEGLRVVACSYRELNESDMKRPTEELLGKLTLLGYIALKDPLRPDAKHSISLTQRAGIRTVLITGDHRLTALSIAREVGIQVEGGGILEGSELDSLSDVELEKRVEHISLIARVSPRHKLRVVQALQRRGEVVAMVGDGVNDAPALKAADVGVAVGSGTDVAKEAADMVLLDDNFRTLAKAVEQGRLVYENIRKVFVYLLADDFSELFLFMCAMTLGMPLPLLAAQILWINLVEDGLPNIAISMEQDARGLMERPPRNPRESIMNAPIKRWLLAMFFITGITAFSTFFVFLSHTGDLTFSRTVVFTLMCVDSLVLAYCVRSFNRSVFRADIFSNRVLNYVIAFSFLLLLGGLYLPPLQSLLSTVPLDAGAWLIIASISAMELLLLEWTKRWSFAPRDTHRRTATAFG